MSPPRRYFVAGTDTAVGKTRVTVGLLTCWRRLGLHALGMKPVAAGGAEDAAMIAAVTGQISTSSHLNPYCLTAPISPHLAAERAGIGIEIETIIQNFLSICRQSDYCLVEGTGGWMTPINSVHTMADVALRLELPVVLVVGLRLGCLNHALLTAEAIGRTGLPLAGWIGNRIDPEQLAQDENIQTLSRRLDSEPLAILPWSADALQHHSHLMPAAQRLLR